MTRKFGATRPNGQKAIIDYYRRYNLVKRGMASWVPLNYMDVAAACERAGL